MKIVKILSTIRFCLIVVDSSSAQSDDPTPEEIQQMQHEIQQMQHEIDKLSKETQQASKQRAPFVEMSQAFIRNTPLAKNKDYMEAQAKLLTNATPACSQAVAQSLVAEDNISEYLKQSYANGRQMPRKDKDIEYDKLVKIRLNSDKKVGEICGKKIPLQLIGLRWKYEMPTTDKP